VQGGHRRHLCRPSKLPAFIDSLTLRNLTLDSTKMNAQISRIPGEVSVSVMEHQGNISVVTTA
jgi:hypothetical protein